MDVENISNSGSVRSNWQRLGWKEAEVKSSMFKVEREAQGKTHLSNPRWGTWLPMTSING
jgi:hypothetical protein